MLKFIEYYPKPDEFIPERFDAEHGGVKAFKDRGVLIPFGNLKQDKF
jgi:cytochrome P450